jgi:hypothetical protein
MEILGMSFRQATAKNLHSVASMSEQNLTVLSEPACIQSFNRFVRETGDSIMDWTFHGKEFPFTGMELAFKLMDSSANSVSIWISANVGETVRARFDFRIKELEKSFLRVEMLKRRIAKIRPELRDSDRARDLREGCYGLIEIEFAGVYSFLNDLKKAFGWGKAIEKKQTVVPVVVPADPKKASKKDPPSAKKSGSELTYRNHLDFLLLYHKYESEQFHNKAIGCREFGRSIVSQGGRSSGKSSSKFFKKAFGSYEKYLQICGEEGKQSDQKRLEFELKKKNGDLQDKDLRPLIEAAIQLEKKRESEAD